MTQPPFLLPAAVLAIVTLTAAAAESREAQDEGDEITQELAALREEFDAIKARYEARLSALETKLETMQKESSLDVDEELERLEERHDRDREALKGEIEKNRRAFAPLAFTPYITMFGNLMGRRDDKTVMSPEGDRIDNRFVFRAGEFELRAAVDPFADAFLAIPLEAESPGGSLEADIEEGYMLMKRLPFVGSPWGLKLKPGKYRPEIGKNNLIHFHDLMWTSRPLPVATFLGTEGLGESAEAGFQVTGVNADFFVPSPSLETTLRMQLGIGTTGNLAVTEANQGDDPVFYGHGSWYQRVRQPSLRARGLVSAWQKRSVWKLAQHAGGRRLHLYVEAGTQWASEVLRSRGRVLLRFARAVRWALEYTARLLSVCSVPASTKPLPRGAI